MTIKDCAVRAWRAGEAGLETDTDSTVEEILRGLGALEHGGRTSSLSWRGETNGTNQDRGKRHAGERHAGGRKSFIQTHDMFSEAQDDEKKW